MNKILVVDNDRIILSFMDKLLKKEGHEVRTAGEGLAALDVLTQFKPEFIFVDLVMPNIDGEMLCKIIRGKAEFKDTYIVVLSAIAAEEVIDISKMGANACVAKGSFKEMGQHILDIIKQPDVAAERSKAGEVFGVKSIFPRGITGELLMSKRHFQIILGNMSEGIVEINPEGRIIYANESAADLIKAPEEKLIGTRFVELFAGESHKRVSRLLARPGDFSLRRPEDLIVGLNDHQVTIQVLPFDEHAFSSIIITDVTDWIKTNMYLEKRKGELELLHQAGKALNSSLELDQVLVSVLEEVRRLIDVTGSTIWMVETGTGELSCRQAAGKGSKYLKGWRLSRGEGLAGWVAANGQSLIVADTRKDDRHLKDVDRETGLEMRSILSAPLMIKENIVGVLQLLDTEPGRFDGSHLSLLEVLAASAAIAIENARLYEQAQKEIRDRQKIEEILRNSEKKYKDIFNNVSDLLYFHDLEGNFTETNLAFLRDYGYSALDMARMNIKDLIPDRYKGRFHDYMQRLLEKGEDEGLMAVKTQSGEDRIVEYRSSIIYEDGQPFKVRGSARDITKRKRAEQALRESEEKYRTILDSIEEGYFEVDLSGNFTFLNSALSKISGYSEKELLGMNNRDYTTPEAAKDVFKVFNSIYRTGRPKRLDKYEVLRKDGEKIMLELSALPILGSDDRPVGFRGVVRDITERLKSEEERKTLEEQLKQSQKLEAIGTLAGGIAHDFNNLLMGIQGNASLMLYALEGDHPHREKLENIEKYVHNGAALTKQLLGFARSGQYELVPVDLNQLIENSSTMFARTKKEINIKTKYQENIWAVEIDKGQIEQVLLNIYVNAWQAMPDGGELFIETRNVTLDKNSPDIAEKVSGDYVMMIVKDTGIGMDAKTQAKIFDPFFTTKEIGRGTGLGLASAYGIIKSHGGLIEVKSKKNKGSTFSIYLPKSGREVVPEKPVAEQIVMGKETILIVDDEEMIVEVGQQILEKIGYRVLTVMSGEEAVKVYKENKDRIDMVILDMIMPGLGGGETYDHIKKINPGVKVLLSSGYSMNKEAAEILKRGCNGFIPKPFDIKKLSSKVREVLDG